MRLRLLRRLVVGPKQAAIVVGVLLLGGGGTGTWLLLHQAPHTTAVRHLEPSPSADPSPTPSDLAASPSPSPVAVVPQAKLAPATARGVGRLSIPAIHVTATIVSVGKDKNGVMLAPAQPFDVAWYNLGPWPGQSGDAVIGGHVTWYTAPVAIFYNLSKLKPGDLITVTKTDGTATTWKVQDNLTYPSNVDPAGIFATGGPPRLTLYTCGGVWDAKKKAYPLHVVVNANKV